MQGARESASAREARLRERRMAQQERTRSAEQLATGLTADYRMAYGPRFSLFNRRR